MSRRSTRRRPVAVALIAAAVAAVPAVPAGAASVSEPVVEGLVGPLGLAIGEDGTIYVAEAFAGQLTAVSNKGDRRVLAAVEGGFLPGVDAGGRGQVVFTESVIPEEEGAAPDTTLRRVFPQGRTTTLASLQEFEVSNNPDESNVYGFVGMDQECLDQLPPFLHPHPGIVESNPYAVTIVPGGYLVADAAANAILKVSPNGNSISVVAVLPPIPQTVTAEVAQEFGLPECVVGHDYHSEPVPTDVEVGPDGNYYVSSLPGAPELPGTGSVWKIDARTGQLTAVAEGFSGAVDLAVAPDGTIYVAELFGGQISRIDDGVVSTVVEVHSPGAVEVTRNGTLYATTGIFSDGQGAVVVVTP